MPITRQPLRERCNVQLTTIATQDLDYCRRRKRRDVPGVRRYHATHQEAYCAASSPQDGQELPIKLSFLHELVPYMFIAFSDGKLSPSSLQGLTGRDLTHILKITHPTPGHKVGFAALKHDANLGIQTLQLTIPRPAHRKGKATLLTQYQMLIARDFLSLALPYYSQARPTEYHSTSSSDKVRLLITAPEDNGSAADIMSVVVCYLAFTSEERAATVLQYIQEGEEVDAVWKDVVSAEEGGVEFIDSVAMMGM